MTKPAVYSEIGKLRTILLHRPGKELENLTPNYLESLLFDDIPYLKVAQSEHDVMASVLKSRDVEVLYVENLIVETLSQDSKIAGEFVDDVIKYNNITSSELSGNIKDFLLSLPIPELVEKIVSGVRSNEINMRCTTLAGHVRREFPFFIRPMVNLYFQRDPVATVGRGVSVNRMSTGIRRREALLMDYVYRYHPMFSGNEIPRYYDLNDPFFIEGGDIEVLSPKVAAVGISQRTEPEAIELLARRLFTSGESFETVLAFEIPQTRAFMHLDTVFTMLDHDKFVVHPKIDRTLKIYSLKYSPKGIKVSSEEGELDSILKRHLNLQSAQIIKCGGDDPIDQDREQWSDGSNTLCISPGTVIAYSRNYVTNSLMRRAGVEVIEIPSSELSRGRGGPRCMSMPIVRDLL